MKMLTLTIVVLVYRNFMIQGGDPTGTGRGGESIWGKPFKDELNSKLVHSGRGVVSMANSGPHTNGSQFFILYKSAKHLNFKHTVFGMVVGGLTTLSAMEKVPVDDDDRPLVCTLPPFLCFLSSVVRLFTLKLSFHICIMELLGILLYKFTLHLVLIQFCL